MLDFSNKTILITGGSGFLGRNLVKRLLSFNNVSIKIFSRDESLQEAFKETLSEEHLQHVKFILGDVRDISSISDATRDVNIVIHAAAVKYLDWAEKQPTDCVKTNILGSMNVINACLLNNVDICVGCSTDKAPYARNVYGCSKQIMEALFSEANQYNKTKFVIVRYGNVVGSTGSVIPKWLKAVKDKKPIIVTDKRMKRFLMTVDQSIDCIFNAIDWRTSVIPRTLKSVNMNHLAELVSKGKVEIKEGKIRPGERLYEILIADYEHLGPVTTDTVEEFTDDELISLIKSIK